LPRLAVLSVLSAASSPCPDLNLIHYKSADAYSGKRFFQNIRRSVASVDWGGNPTSIKVV